MVPLDESYENDITGKKETYVTTLEGKKLITKGINWLYAKLWEISDYFE